MERVDLSWNAVTGATSYDLRRWNTETSSWDSIGHNPTGTSYDDGLESGETYYCVIRAVNAGGNGNPPPPVNGGGMRAPAWPPLGLIVTHAATQVQQAPVGDGLHVYLIGSDGTGHSGPYIDSFSNLAQQHAGVATLWTGTSPGTGKSVTIYYLAGENKIGIST